MSNKRLYVDFHIIQTVPPSCVNRDDTGSPKTATYGGVQRARVSSQSWKRAIRKAFSDLFDEADLGVRTKKIVEIVQARILAQDESLSEDEACKRAEAVLEKAGVNLKDGEAKALFFMSSKQADNLAVLALKNLDDAKDAKKLVQAALRKNTGVDVALFGRMVADDPSLNSDASCQVAHAVSTHRVDNEYDYFTAVDDRAPEDNAGAGMIGTVEYNSSTLYRYATIAAHELLRQLNNSSETTSKVVAEFTKAFITSMPTGKQNTFANRTLPDAVIVSVRVDQPINLVGAFEQPIQAGQEAGYVTGSVEKLIEQMKNIEADYCGAPERIWVIGESASSLADPVSLPALLAEMEEEVNMMLTED